MNRITIVASEKNTLRGAILLLLAVVLTFLFSPLTSPPALADTFNDFEYTINADGTTATITGYTGIGEDIIIPETVDTYTVTAIGSDLFTSVSVTSVSIPKSVLSIESGAFWECRAMQSFTVDADNPSYKSVDGIIFSKDDTVLVHYPAAKAGTAYTLPNTVTTIGDCAFDHNQNLQSITLTEYVTQIGSCSFWRCDALSSFIVPGSVTTIGNSPLANCSLLTEITVGTGSTSFQSIGGVLFDISGTSLIQCPAGKIGSYTVPAGVTTIKSGAFRGCTKLISVTSCNDVTDIEDCAFAYCDSLTSVELGSGVQTLKYGAFLSCSALESVTLPASVTTIDNNVFDGCSTLRNACFMGNAPAVGTDVFSNCAYDFTAYHTASATGFTNPWSGYPTAVFDRAVTRTVAFDLNSAEGTSPTSQTVNDGMRAICPVDPTNGEKYFGGWYTEATCENEWDFATAVTGDLTLFAKWKDYISVKYRSNGASGGSVPIDSTEYHKDDEAKIMGNINGLALADYELVAWNTKPDGSGTRYTLGEEINVENKDVILYADWTSCTVFNISDGIYDMEDFGDEVIINIEAESEVTLTNVNDITVFGTRIQCEKDVILTIDGIDIDNSDYMSFCPISFCDVKNRIILNGQSSLSAGAEQPGIKVETGAMLRILGDGVLFAQNASDGTGAGIGGANGKASGWIVVMDGEVHAYSKDSGAGMGGGAHGNCGSVIIQGGLVNSRAFSGAGIGGGAYGQGGGVNITGGVVAARSDNSAQDIGYGKYSYGASLSISGDAMVLLKNGNSPSGAGSHALYSTDYQSDGKVFGIIDVPIGWENDTIYAYLDKTKVSDITYSLNDSYNNGMGTVLQHIIQFNGTTIEISSGEDLSQNGIDFLCWNTKRDYSGDVYYPGEQYTFSNNITLYAAFGYPYEVGDGNAENPYEVSTPEQLYTVRCFPNAYFEMVNDIDLSTVTSEGGKFYNEGIGWKPIEKLNGTFDGKGHSVIGLNIHQPVYRWPMNYIGLFGEISSSAIIQNLSIKSSNILSADYIGSIAGLNYGTISNCINEGDIQGSDRATIGGIAGYNEGEIINCYNIGNISSSTGTGGCGGIAGQGDGTISKCFNLGNIIANDYNGIAGGIQYLGSPSINDCYNSGDILGNSKSGGILADSLGATVNNCYNVGSISGRTPGGIIGTSILELHLNNCYYYNIENDAVGSGNSVNTNVKIKTKEELQTQSHFEGFDFDNIWEIAENRFPILRNIPYVYVTGIDINSNSEDLHIDDSMTLTAEIGPDNATNKRIVWSSSNTAVATVNNGVVYAVGGGTAVITAESQDGGFIKTCNVTVTQPLIGVKLDTHTLNIRIGNKNTLHASFTPANALNKNATWTSDNNSVATVDQYGEITGISKGDATITITTEEGGYTDTCSVTVIQPVTTVSLNSHADTIVVGDTATLSATVSPSDANYKTVTWSSSKTSVATIDQDGKVTAVAPGNATITATADGKSDTCAITIKKRDVTSVLLGCASGPIPSTVKIGSSLNLTATVSPSDATYKTVTWSSSKTSVATVDQNGKVTAVNLGNATIRATADGVSGACTITVEKIDVTGVSLGCTSGPIPSAIKVGSNVSLTADISPDEATYKTVTWSSSKTSVATVDQNGKVTAVAPGSATITATADGKSAACNITVEKIDVTGVALNKTSETVKVGNTLMLTATVSPADATYKTVTWSSSKPSVATVDENGKVTAVAVGSATITATADGKSAACDITVNPSLVSITASVNNAAFGYVSGGGAYTIGQNVILTAYPYPGYRFVRWLQNGTVISANPYHAFTALNDMSLTAEFAQLSPISLSFTKQDVKAFNGSDGSITLSGSGGDSGSYQYSINGGVNSGGGYFGNLTTGTYTALVRDASYPANMASCIITINQPAYVGSVPANKVAPKASAGTAVSLVPSAPKGYTLQSSTYSSSNPAVATVDASGNVTFVGGGKVTIIITTVSQTIDKKGNVKAKTTITKKAITVIQPVQSISLNMAKATIARTQKITLRASFDPVTASNKKVKWMSSNPKVASVSGSGMVTGKAGGTAVITCIAQDGSRASASCAVTVTPVYPVGVNLSKASLTLKLGKAATLKASIAPKTTDFKTVTWVSSNPAVVNVDGKGKLKALSSGTAVITATTSNGISASCFVTVP